MSLRGASKRKYFIFLIFLAMLFFVGRQLSNNGAYELLEPVDFKQEGSTTSPQLMLKDVGEPFLENFGLTGSDFRLIQQNGISIIEGNFDICASTDEVLEFLDSAHTAGLKVVLPAGSGEAEWGYACDEKISPTQKPRWDEDAVTAWVQQWKDHPSLFAWDISNEAGGNFPNAGHDGWEDEFALTLPQFQKAYQDVKTVDPDHPVIIRMNGWYFYDYDSDFFRAGNPFGPEVADIVMINAYSNVEDYYSDFVMTVVSRAKDEIFAVAPDTKLIVALGGWEELPLWHKPPIDHFGHDYNEAIQTGDLIAVAVFKYGASGEQWWMPESYPELWQFLQSVSPDLSD